MKFRYLIIMFFCVIAFLVSFFLIANYKTNCNYIDQTSANNDGVDFSIVNERCMKFSSTNDIYFTLEAKNNNEADVWFSLRNMNFASNNPDSSIYYDTIADVLSSCSFKIPPHQIKQFKLRIVAPKNQNIRFSSWGVDRQPTEQICSK